MWKVQIIAAINISYCLGFVIDVDTRKRDLERVFEKYGRLREIWMARNPPCFAFVVYAHQKDADRALKETDGM